MKDTTDKQQRYRAKMRDVGYVLKHLWTKPSKWPQIQALANKLNGRDK
jgi:hypothetical protein